MPGIPEFMTQVPPSRSPSGRIRAMQHPLDAWIYHPIAARLAQLLSKTAVTPNMVSAAGGLMVALAGFIYIQQGWPYTAMLGLLVHASWHVLDGADGDLARLTGKSSPQGEIFDGICDYTGHVVLYLTLAYSASDTLGWSAWALAVAAGASRIVQANFYESQRRQFMYWAHGVAWLRTTQSEKPKSPSSGLGSAYLKLASVLAPGDRTIDQALAEPAAASTLRRRLRELGPYSLSGSSLLGANYRTLALGAAMLAGSPLWYFLYEIVVLNLVLLEAVARSRRTLAHLREAVPSVPSTAE